MKNQAMQIVEIRDQQLSPSRSMLQDHLAAVAEASAAVHRASEPVNRLEHWTKECSEAETALREFDAAFQSELTTWASHGAGAMPTMDGKKRETLALRVATATAKKNAAQAAAAEYQAAQATAYARLNELNAALPGHVADVLLEVGRQITDHHNALLAQAATLRSHLQALGDLLCSDSMNKGSSTTGYRAAERLRGLIAINPQASPEEHIAARSRVAAFANTVSLDPGAAF